MLARPDTLTQLQLDLLNAADYLDKNGHCRLRLRNEKGNVCLGGALRSVILGEAELYTSQEKLSPGDLRMRRCYERLTDALGGRGPVDWNDSSGRTKDEVTALLRKAAFLGE